MRSLINRGLALATAAASCCATGLLAPATASAATAALTPGYFIESADHPGLVLTGLQYGGPVRIDPFGRVDGQVWELAPTEDGVSLVNRDSGACVSFFPFARDAPVELRPCDGSLEQSWRQQDAGDGTVRFFALNACLAFGPGVAETSRCEDFFTAWRLVPVEG
ncbi:RICIN domain-containing protein [Actinospica robiniae]|uniref:RICIN domain-containing protein n=1 Tax=Actinospica robiniae TaxID=304901 RepID=UPI0003FDFC2C|nr:RICIN domain-containing protein [Actinospica robiniae]